MHLLNKWNILQEDFIGFHVDIVLILQIISFVLFTIVFFAILYLFGEKLRRRFFFKTETWNEKYFINIALGYIAIFSGLTLIGLFSLLTPFYLSLYLLTISLLAVFPMSSLKSSLREIKDIVKVTWRTYLSDHFWIKVSIILFVVLAALRLLPPEVGADAMNYHTTFPKLYLYYQTFRLDPGIHVAPIAIPQLGEMPYVLTVFFNLIDASRYIHFGFYLLCILLLLSSSYMQNKKELRLYVALLFASSPIVLHHAPSAYSDLPQMFCFLLTIFILIKEIKIEKQIFYLMAIIMGGAMATKAFAILYLPSILLYMLYGLYKTKKLTVKKAFTQTVPFVTVALLFPLPWYLYSFSLFGNPHSFYLFTPNSTEPIQVDFVKMFLMAFNWIEKLNPYVLLEYSPLAVFGLIGLVFYFRKSVSQISKLPIINYILFFLIIYIFYPPHLYTGRYSLPVVTLLMILISPGLALFNENIYRKYIFQGAVALLFLYFCFNTLVILPYGLGWAKTENYLKRTLFINSTTYYDFGGKFSENLTKDEVVAVYGLDQFYYASFIPNHVYKFFKHKEHALSDIEKNNISKLLIRGGDITWFCKNLAVKDCKQKDMKLLVHDEASKQYLYEFINN